MKVSLTRNVMIAGTPKSAGSIVDVDQHIGDMLIGIGKAEVVVEACEAPIAEPVKEKPLTNGNLTPAKQVKKVYAEPASKDDIDPIETGEWIDSLNSVIIKVFEKNASTLLASIAF